MPTHLRKSTYRKVKTKGGGWKGVHVSGSVVKKKWKPKKR